MNISAKWMFLPAMLAGILAVVSSWPEEASVPSRVVLRGDLADSARFTQDDGFQAVESSASARTAEIAEPASVQTTQAIAVHPQTRVIDAPQRTVILPPTGGETAAEDTGN